MPGNSLEVDLEHGKVNLVPPRVALHPIASRFVYMTSSQINDTFLFHRVIKIPTAGRILQISIAWCQIEAEIHSFLTMYGKGEGICGKNWRNKGFRPKVMPKTRFF